MRGLHYTNILQPSLQRRYDIRTFNNLPFRDVMRYEHLSTFPIGVLWDTDIYKPSLYGRYDI